MFFSADFNMARYFVGFCQLVRRALLRWMAGSTAAAEEISAPSAAGRVSWRLTINVASVWRRRVVIRTQLRRTVADRCPALVDARAASRVRIRCTA